MAQFEPLFIGALDAAKWLDVSHTTLYHMLKTDETFPRPTYLGRSPKFLVEELRQWAYSRQRSDPTSRRGTMSRKLGMVPSTRRGGEGNG